MSCDFSKQPGSTLAACHTRCDRLGPPHSTLGGVVRGVGGPYRPGPATCRRGNLRCPHCPAGPLRVLVRLACRMLTRFDGPPRGAIRDREARPQGPGQRPGVVPGPPAAAAQGPATAGGPCGSRPRAPWICGSRRRCPPCPRTLVQHVSGLDSWAGCGRIWRRGSGGRTGGSQAARSLGHKPTAPLHVRVRGCWCADDGRVGDPLCPLERVKSGGPGGRCSTSAWLLHRGPPSPPDRVRGRLQPSPLRRPLRSGMPGRPLTEFGRGRPILPLPSERVKSRHAFEFERRFASVYSRERENERLRLQGQGG